MLKRTILILFVFLFSLFPNDSANTIENSNKSRYANDHFIVKLKSNLSASAGITGIINDEALIRNISDEFELKISKVKKLFPLDIKHAEDYYRYELDKYYLVYIEENKDITDLCKKFENNHLVDFSEPDYIGESAAKKEIDPELPNDEFFARQWGLFNIGNVTTTKGRPGKPGADMKVVEGWDVFKGDGGVIVAVLDSGTKLNHPDLKDRLWINAKEIKNGKDDDLNGYIDDIMGYNFAYNNSNVTDDGGHGTNIAGTIGAKANNIIGYTGVDQQCRIMTCKNLDSDNLGEYSWWSESLYYAANNGAKIINMSEGGYDFSRTLKNAVDYANEKGCLIIASMMNKNNNERYYPASFNNVLAVGATDTDDTRCKQFTWGGGSNWGKHISVVAPGNKIYGLDNKDDYDYSVYWSGTSQATAYVSAVASLLLGQSPFRTNIDLRKIITLTADDMVGDPREDKAGWDEYHGYGRVNLLRALSYDKNLEVKYYKREQYTGIKNKEIKTEYDIKQAKAVYDSYDIRNNNRDKKAEPIYK